MESAADNFNQTTLPFIKFNVMKLLLTAIGDGHIVMQFCTTHESP